MLPSCPPSIRQRWQSEILHLQGTGGSPSSTLSTKPRLQYTFVRHLPLTGKRLDSLHCRQVSPSSEHTKHPQTLHLRGTVRVVVVVAGGPLVVPRGTLHTPGAPAPLDGGDTQARPAAQYVAYIGGRLLWQASPSFIRRYRHTPRPAGPLKSAVHTSLSPLPHGIASPMVHTSPGILSEASVVAGMDGADVVTV